MLNISTSPSDVKKGSPVTQQSKGTGTPKSPSPEKPFQGIEFKGAPTKIYPLILSGCRVDKDQLDRKLLRTDLEQTQTDLFCIGAYIANPEAEWKCEFKPDALICQGREAYTCARQYQCIPETANYNKARFKKEIKALS